jgi:hypothetical protein
MGLQLSFSASFFDLLPSQYSDARDIRYPHQCLRQCSNVQVRLEILQRRMEIIGVIFSFVEELALARRSFASNPGQRLPQPTTEPAFVAHSRQASFAISRHLGLEAFEPVDLQGESFTGLFDEQQFVGKGASNAALLSIDENVAKGQS